MATKRYVVSLTTNASGAATEYTPVLSGILLSIHYVKTDFADGVDFTITSEATGQNLWVESNVNAAAVRSPQQPTHSQAGVVLTDAEEPIVLAQDRVKIVIAEGGDTKSGTFHIVMV